MFFLKKKVAYKWHRNGPTELKGKIILRITSQDFYDDLWFKIPYNSPHSLDFVPIALQIKGEIEEGEGLPYENETAYFLIPRPDFEELNLHLQPGDRIQLWLNAPKRCFKIEKVK
jgi:hypothetical protein